VNAPAKFIGRSGQLVGGRYELMEMIGSGGQSVVYRALDRIDGDHVALKISEWSDPDATERMYREALVMSQLQNTAAVRVLHQCQTEDGSLALVMELLAGSDLSSVLHMREGRGLLADHAWMASILVPIVRTLEAAHERGIVHRDLKAENVFVLDPQNGGGVRLLDFGFAKMMRMPAITAAEVFAGSPSYIAPEVWREGAWRADPRVDIYALGILVFRLLGGRMPFEGTTVEIARAALTGERPSLHALRPDLSPDIDAWVVQVLSIDPEDRFAKITAAWRALEGCLEAP
jgi:eukaryotic-like serine/threonine-protein kinase